MKYTRYNLGYNAHRDEVKMRLVRNFSVGKIEEVLNNAPQITPIINGKLQPIKTPEWQVSNSKALAQALYNLLGEK